MEKKYKKILNDDGRIEYVEDANGRYTEKDFEGEFVLKGSVNKSEKLINEQNEEKNKKIIKAVITAVLFVALAVNIFSSSDEPVEKPYRYSA